MSYHFITNYINFPLIIVFTSMMSRHCLDCAQCIRFSIILGHNKQTTAIKLTITKVNNTRMATVMFPKQCLRGIGQKSTYRL